MRKTNGDPTLVPMSARREAGSEIPRTSLPREIARAARALRVLVREHVKLAQIELRNEGRRVVIHSAVVLVALPFLLTALVILSVALALGLSAWVGPAWAFLFVGLLDLGIGGALALYGSSKLREEPLRTLRHTRRELQKDRAMVRVVQGPSYDRPNSHT